MDKSMCAAHAGHGRLHRHAHAAYTRGRGVAGVGSGIIVPREWHNLSGARHRKMGKDEPMARMKVLAVCVVGIVAAGLVSASAATAFVKLQLNYKGDGVVPAGASVYQKFLLGAGECELFDEGPLVNNDSVIDEAKPLKLTGTHCAPNWRVVKGNLEITKLSFAGFGTSFNGEAEFTAKPKIVVEEISTKCQWTFPKSSSPLEGSWSPVIKGLTDQIIGVARGKLTNVGNGMCGPLHSGFPGPPSFVAEIGEGPTKPFESELF